MSDDLLQLIDLQKLTKWMDDQGLGSGEISAAKILSGGTQNILLSFDKGDRAFILRRPPPHPRSNSNNTMRREARMLSALKGTDVPHPELIAPCNDESILGAAFI